MNLSHARCAVGVILAIALASCNKQPSTREAVRCGLDQVIPSTPGLDFVACPLNDTIPMGDPALVYVALKNGDTPLNVFGRLIIGVTVGANIRDSSGVALRPSNPGSWEPGLIAPDSVNTMVLFSQSTLGRVIELGCGRSDEGDGTLKGCVPLYEFPRPGKYMVTMSYSVACGDPPCPRTFPWVGRLEAKSFVLTVR
jgi:hypothetical protein